MFKSRRNKSLGGSKTDAIKASHINIPQKDAIAIVPPKRVIKALYDYNAPSDPPHYLSFSQGEFLHVVARENDDDWYEACNPLQGTRGLVPVKYFETIGKTTRDSKGSEQSTPHDSGYAENASPAGHRASKSVGKMNGAMVYGVVAYDFHAERADELDAKAGEAIIVIAQSNPEWFVAKPITRLGGPGLIPVSFIDIKDMQTGQTIADPSEAIAKAGIPRVEEWKKMAADYKNTSIPLGQFGVAPAQQPAALQNSMARMSLGTQANRQSATRSLAAPATPGPAAGLVYAMTARVPRFLYADDKFHFIVECTMSNGIHWDLSRIYEDFYELQIQLLKAFPMEAGKDPHQPRILPYMPGPVPVVNESISEGRRDNLDEYLQQLLKLSPYITQSSLVLAFFTPRQGDLEVDPSQIEPARSPPPIMSPPQRLSANMPPSQYQQQMGYAPQHMRQLSSATGAQQPIPRSTPADHYRNPSEMSQGSGGHQAPPMQRQLTESSASSIPSSQSPITPATAALPTPSGTAPAAAASSAALKVKVWFDRDTCVMLRMPPRGSFTFADMYSKIVERRRLEFAGRQQQQGAEGGEVEDSQLEIEYRDERDGDYYKLADDEELNVALETNEKLTLVVREAKS